MIVPENKPRAKRIDIEPLIEKHGLNLKREGIVIVGIRGYYKNTFGKPYENDRNFYDDAIFLLTSDFFKSFNANVDPSKYRKGIATLKTGVYKVVKHKHRGKYKALQIVEDIVIRDGVAKEDKGRHGINFHYGGINNTHSEGCQTLPKEQFLDFQSLVYRLMDVYGMTQVTYLLVEN